MATPLISGVTMHLRTGIKQFRRINILNKQIQERTQYYSIYSPHYINPIYDPKKQKEIIEAGELSKYNHIPIKAALNNETSSVYNNTTLMKFQNYVMRCGNKKLARSLVEQAFEKVKRIQLEKYNKEEDPAKRAEIIIDPLQILYNAVENCKPLLMLTPIKRGGAKYQNVPERLHLFGDYKLFKWLINERLFELGRVAAEQVPVPITDKRALFMSMNWLIQAGQDKELTVHWPDKMAYELIDAAYNKGRVVKRKQELHRQCEANRAYAHYRWS